MSSVLETFLILFESDASDVKKGAEEAGQSTKKLKDQLGGANQATNVLGNSFKNMAVTAVASLAAAFSFGAIVSGIQNAAEYADSLGEVSDALGVNVEDLDAWGAAAKMAGGSAEGFQSSLQNLVTSFAQISTTGKSRALPFFKELGISMTDTKGKVRDVMDVLPELADAFQGMSKAQSFGMGQKLGLDQGTIMLLQRGRRSVEDLIARQRELGVVTKEDAEIAGAYKDAIDENNRSSQSFYRTIGALLLPILTKIMNGFASLAKVMSKYKFEIEAGLYMIAAGLLAVGVNALIAVGPIALVVAAIVAVGTALALVYGDIMNFISGNDSLIGRLLAAYPIIKQFGAEFVGVFKDIWAWVEKAYAAVVRFLNKIPGIGDFLDRGDVSLGVTQGKMALASAGGTPLNAQSSNMISNSASRSDNTNVSIQSVTVQTQATDASGVAQGLDGALKAQVRQAKSNSDDGVAY